MAIETRGLARHFGSLKAVDGIDLAVPAGSTYGFLGPNGSGKTTTIRVLLGLVSPTSGSWSLLGQPMPERSMTTLPHVGALVEGPAFYPWLSGLDNLAKKKYRAYSLGMRQRLGLAWALMRPSQLLVLDEPTNGMDPQGTREIRHLIRQLAAEGATVFLSSHLLSEIEQVCSHVGVMNRGKLLMQGTLDDLKAGASPKLRVEADDPVRAAEVLTRMGMADVAVQGPQLVGSLDGLLPEDCCRSLVEAGVAVRMLLREQLSLEDAFVALTGEGFNVAG
jgi:ABC-type multidrug transport system ATPase subunit